MADPLEVDITPKDTWVKVATAVVSGHVHVLASGPSGYIHTYRDTGGAIPTDPLEGVRFGGVTEQISAAAPIDVYIMSLNAVGKVRVDL